MNSGTQNSAPDSAGLIRWMYNSLSCSRFNGCYYFKP